MFTEFGDCPKSVGAKYRKASFGEVFWINTLREYIYAKEYIYKYVQYFYLLVLLLFQQSYIPW